MFGSRLSLNRLAEWIEQRSWLVQLWLWALSCMRHRPTKYPKKRLLRKVIVSVDVAVGSIAPTALDLWETSGHVHGSAICLRHHRADTGGRHQPSAHLIVPDDGQQAATAQDDESCSRSARRTMRSGLTNGLLNTCGSCHRLAKVPEFFWNLLGPGFIQRDVGPEFIGRVL